MFIYFLLIFTTAVGGGAATTSSILKKSLRFKELEPQTTQLEGTAARQIGLHIIVHVVTVNHQNPELVLSYIRQVDMAGLGSGKQVPHRASSSALHWVSV